MIRTAAILVLIMIAAGCAQSPAPEAFPQDVADAWAERYAANDAAGVAALYTEDAQLLPPDMEVVSGRAAIQEFVAKTNPPGGPHITPRIHHPGDNAHHGSPLGESSIYWSRPHPRWAEGPRTLEEYLAHLRTLFAQFTEAAA